MGIVADRKPCELRSPPGRGRPGLPGFFQEENRGVDSAVFDPQPSHTHRQSETSWPRAAGIEVEYAVFPFLLGYVTVSIDDGREFRRFRLQVEFLKIV